MISKSQSNGSNNETRKHTPGELPLSQSTPVYHPTGTQVSRVDNATMQETTSDQNGESCNGLDNASSNNQSDKTESTETHLHSVRPRAQSVVWESNVNPAKDSKPLGCCGRCQAIMEKERCDYLYKIHALMDRNAELVTLYNQAITAAKVYSNDSDIARTTLLERNGYIHALEVQVESLRKSLFQENTREVINLLNSLPSVIEGDEAASGSEKLESPKGPKVDHSKAAMTGGGSGVSQGKDGRNTMRKSPAGRDEAAKTPKIAISTDNEAYLKRKDGRTVSFSTPNGEKSPPKQLSYVPPDHTPRRWSIKEAKSVAPLSRLSEKNKPFQEIKHIFPSKANLSSVFSFKNLDNPTKKPMKGSSPYSQHPGEAGLNTANEGILPLRRQTDPELGSMDIYEMLESNRPSPTSAYATAGRKFSKSNSTSALPDFYNTYNSNKTAHMPTGTNVTMAKKKRFTRIRAMFLKEPSNEEKKKSMSTPGLVGMDRTNDLSNSRNTVICSKSGDFEDDSLYSLGTICRSLLSRSQEQGLSTDIQPRGEQTKVGVAKVRGSPVLTKGVLSLMEKRNRISSASVDTELPRFTRASLRDDSEMNSDKPGVSTAGSSPVGMNTPSPILKLWDAPTVKQGNSVSSESDLGTSLCLTEACLMEFDPAMHSAGSPKANQAESHGENTPIGHKEGSSNEQGGRAQGASSSSRFRVTMEEKAMLRMSWKECITIATLDQQFPFASLCKEYFITWSTLCPCVSTRPLGRNLTIRAMFLSTFVALAIGDYLCEQGGSIPDSRSDTLCPNSHEKLEDCLDANIAKLEQLHIACDMTCIMYLSAIQALLMLLDKRLNSRPGFTETREVWARALAAVAERMLTASGEGDVMCFMVRDILDSPTAGNTSLSSISSQGSNPPNSNLLAPFLPASRLVDSNLESDDSACSVSGNISASIIGRTTNTVVPPKILTFPLCKLCSTSASQE